MSDRRPGGGARKPLAPGNTGAAVLIAAAIAVVLAFVGLIAWIEAQPEDAAGQKIVLALTPAGSERTEDLIRPADKPETSTAAPEAGKPAHPAPAGPAEHPPGPVQGGAPLPASQGPDGRLSLAPAPDKSLIADGPNGVLPVIAPNGRRAWRAYARPFSAPAGQPRVAVLIGGLGKGEAATEAAIGRLPGAVTLAFDPYGRDLQASLNKARAAGHEALIELPMEPYDYPQSDPGPYGLLTNLPPPENVARLEWLLGRVAGYVGATNAFGTKFVASANALRPVLQVLNARGLLFFGNSNLQDTPAVLEVARAVGIPFAARDLVLDAQSSRGAIDAQLAALVAKARRDGQAIGVASPYPVTIERVTAWAAGLAAQGIALAPLSALARPLPSAAEVRNAG